MDISTLQILTGGIDAADSISNAFADIAQGNFIAQQFKFNEAVAGIQGQEAILQGQEQQQVSQERTAQLSGEQVAAEAAQGVDVHTGTPAVTRQQTGDIGAEDYLTLGNNAFLKSLGYKIDAINNSTQAGMAQLSATNKAEQSLLGGGEELFQAGIKAINYDQLNQTPNSQFNPQLQEEDAESTFWTQANANPGASS